MKKSQPQTHMGNAIPKRNYISLEQAQECLLEHTPLPSRMETLPLMDALGRVLAQRIHAQMDYPPFHRSPLDGFALIASDTRDASAAMPVQLDVAQCVHAGGAPTTPLAFGQAARVTTGAMLPPKADCVVRQEDVCDHGDTVSIFAPLRPYENYIRRGEDVEAGHLLAGTGSLVDYTMVGVLAAQGYTHLPVFTRPRVGVLSTGDELAPGGAPLPPGKIYDSNQPLVAVRMASLGARVAGGSCGDDIDSLHQAIGALLEDNDLVVTSGGVSVGEKDHMPRVVQRLGGHPLFHGVSIKPGSPVLAMEKDDKLLIALSGNPFAVAATLEVLVVPVLKKMAGAAQVMPLRATGILKTGFPRPSAGRRLVRAHMVGQEVTLPPGGHTGQRHSSGSLSTLVGCNALVDIPAGSGPLAPGDAVEVILL